MTILRTLFSKSSSRLIPVLGLLFALALASGAFAQGGSQGALDVTVRDPNGGAVPGAQVDVVSQETGVTARTVTTGGNGQVTITLLQVGTYRVVVTATGFSRAEAPDIIVQVTETTSITVPLTVGGVADTVTVTDVSTPVQLTSATTGQTLSSETVGTLPLSTRNFLNLLSLSAGANGELVQSDALGRGAVSLNVNGQRPTNNNYQLEGINANDLNLPTFDNVPLPNPQAIREFKTQLSLYDASQGRNGGGNIQVAIQSGTNEFNGDVFEFFRNNVLNANDFFRNRNGQPRPTARQNQFGGSIGGPIYLPRSDAGGAPAFVNTQRLFFFFNYQGTRAASGTAAGTNFATNIPVLPTNRSEANLRAIFFPGGLPPGFTSLDPVALRLLNLPGSATPGFGGDFAIPSLPGTPGFTGAGTLSLASLNRAGLGTFNDNQYVVSIDAQLTQNNRLTGRYFNSVNNLFQPFAGGSSLAFGRTTPTTNRFVKIGLTSVLTPRVVNDFRAGFNRYTFALVPDEPISLTDIGATRGNSAQFPAIFRFAVTGAFSIGTGVNDDRGGAFNTFVLGDDLSFTFGRHSFRVGGEASHYELNRFNNFATRGSATFANTSVNAGGAGIPALVGFQNFLLGRITGTQGRAGFSTFYFRATDASFYVQDDFRVTPRLTFNLGVRFEGLSVADEKFNFLSNLRGLRDGEPGPLQFISPESTPVVGTPGVSDCTLLDCFRIYPAPRFGFAYDLFGDQTTVVRGGYGIYYQRVSNQPLLQTSGGSPFSEDFSAAPFSVTTTNPFPGQRPSSDFPLPTRATIPLLSSFNAATGAPVFNSAGGGPFSGFLFYPVRNFRAPYAQQFNLTIQREIFSDTVAEIGYVGSRGVDLIGTGRPLNPGQICTAANPCTIPASLLAPGFTLPAGTPGVTRNGDGSLSITQSTASNINARVPAQFLGIATSRLFAQENAAQSTYHSLQASLARRFSRGLYYQLAYTFSKSIDNASGSSFTDELNGLFQFGDLFDLRGQQRGLSDFDRTHRFVASFNLDLPTGRLFNVEDRGIGRLLNGYSLNGILTLQSGTPFVIVDSSAITLQDTNFINGTNFATLAPGATLADVLTPGSTRDRLDGFVNLNAFMAGGRCVDNQNRVVDCASPSSTGFAAVGDVGRNIFRGPFQQNFDLSVVKITPITEGTSLEFRAEFFNVFNTPSFQSPQAAGGSLGNYGYVDVAGGDSSILATANRPRTIQFAVKFNF